MTTQGLQKYHRFSDYVEAYEAIRNFYVMALAHFAAATPNTFKNRILRNFIASAISRLDSILRLFEANNYDDCWILHRALVDRYVHLRSLVRKNDFDEFERWSFQRRFRDADTALNNPQVAAQFGPELMKQARELRRTNQTRMNQEPQSNWRRPSAKQELSGQTLSPLFIGGYNFASTKVHPMDDDGKDDFARLVMRTPNPQARTIEVIHNSFVVFMLTINEWFKSEEVLWRSFVESFYMQLLEFLETGTKDYVATCATALQLDPIIKWCEPAGETPG